MTPDNDLLQKFIDNEKKSRTWTLVSVLAFCFFALGLIYLAARLKKTSDQLDQRTEQLKTALEKADSLNNSLNQKVVSLNRLSAERDSLIRLLPGFVNMSNNKIVEALVKGSATNSRYTVYIQYMPGYKAQAEAIPRALTGNFYVPELEKVDRFNFSSAIKYFNNDDKDGALQLADLINTRIAKFKNDPIHVVFARSNVPKGQMEIWLGENRKLTTEEILKKY